MAKRNSGAEMSRTTNGAAFMELMPKKPLTAYNLFFLLERQRILDESDQLNLPILQEELAMISKIQKLKPKRVHRKSHGKISFRQLARTIANRWKNLDDASKQVCYDQAKVEKQIYEKELEQWNQQVSLVSVMFCHSSAQTTERNTTLHHATNAHNRQPIDKPQVTAAVPIAPPSNPTTSYVHKPVQEVNVLGSSLLEMELQLRFQICQLQQCLLDHNVQPLLFPSTNCSEEDNLLETTAMVFSKMSNKSHQGPGNSSKVQQHNHPHDTVLDQETLNLLLSDD